MTDKVQILYNDGGRFGWRRIYPGSPSPVGTRHIRVSRTNDYAIFDMWTYDNVGTKEADDYPHKMDVVWPTVRVVTISTEGSGYLHGELIRAGVLWFLNGTDPLETLTVNERSE